MRPRLQAEGVGERHDGAAGLVAAAAAAECHVAHLGGERALAGVVDAHALRQRRAQLGVGQLESSGQGLPHDVVAGPQAEVLGLEQALPSSATISAKISVMRATASRARSEVLVF